MISIEPQKGLIDLRLTPCAFQEQKRDAGTGLQCPVENSDYQFIRDIKWNRGTIRQSLKIPIQPNYE